MFLICARMTLYQDPPSVSTTLDYSNLVCMCRKYSGKSSKTNIRNEIKMYRKTEEVEGNWNVCGKTTKDEKTFSRPLTMTTFSFQLKRNGCLIVLFNNTKETVGDSPFIYSLLFNEIQPFPPHYSVNLNTFTFLLP